jgi:hypothetical protein
VLGAISLLGLGFGGSGAGWCLMEWGVCSIWLLFSRFLRVLIEFSNFVSHANILVFV